MRRIVFVVIAILSLLIVPVLTSAGTPTTAPTVFATPADVYAAALKATRAGDTRTVVSCLSPETQAEWVSMCVSLILSEPTTAPSDSDKDKVALEAKYGLDHPQRRPGETDEQLADRLAAQIKDKVAFLNEWMSHDAAQDKADPGSQPAPELVNVHIEGDGTVAVAKLVQHEADGSTTSMDVKFKKIDGSWKIDSMMLF